MKNKSLISLCQTALFVALVFIATFLLKIPYPYGYLHMGDTMIFLAVALIGWKKGFIAGAIGAALSDFYLGYFIWVGPTFAFKAIMAIVTGLIFNLLCNKQKNPVAALVAGSVVGGALQCLCYSIASYFIYGGWGAFISSLPGNLAQTGAGIAIAAFLFLPLRKLKLN